MLHDRRSAIQVSITTSASGCAERELTIFIPFTQLRLTQRSIAHAEWLCSGLPASIHVVRVMQVPYPLDLDHPAVAPDAVRSEMEALESELPLKVDLWYSRDWMDGFLRAIPDSSLVIVTYQRSWLFPNREERLARRLRLAGHRVSTFLEDKRCV